MSLEAVVFQRLQSSNGHGRRDYTTPSTRQGDDEPSIHHTFLPYYELPILKSGQYTQYPAGSTLISVASSSLKSCNPVSNNVIGCWRKRRITRKRKRSGDEEEERQRKNHIQVERNRRKQMNSYLSLLRSLMPPSYSRRGEQASIVGGAINFVKELEQHLQCLQAHHHKKARLHHQPTAPPVFSDFFNFPQYSTATTLHGTEVGAVADVEVTLAEQHVAVKVLTRNQPKQLLHLLVELSSAHLMILHLNVTSVDASVLYSFSLKREEECQLSTVKEMATAVHNMIRRIQHLPNLEL